MKRFNGGRFSFFSLLAALLGLAACSRSPAVTPARPSATVAAVTVAPRPSATVAAAATPDATLTAIVAAVQASSPPQSITYPSPDQRWQVELRMFACAASAEAETYAYETLSLDRSLGAGPARVVVDSQLINCGGAGAYGLDGILWSPNSRYFYYTTAREGVPDGCGFWQRPLRRLEVAAGASVDLGGGPFSPDGAQLVTWLDQQLVLWDINQGELARWPALDPTGALAALDWSPDGRAVAYLLAPAVCDPSVAGRSTVVRVDVAGLSQSALLTTEVPTIVGLTWADPDFITLFDAQNGQWRLDARRGALTAVTSTPAPASAPSPMPTPTATPLPPAPVNATLPPPPQPTASVELARPAPLPTPGGPLTAYPSLNSITDLAFAPDGALWAASYEGLVRWDLAADRAQRFDQAAGLPAPGVLSLAFAPDGSLWAGTQAGVARFDGARWTAYPLRSASVTDIIYDIAVAPDGVVWAGADRGASAFDGRTWRNFTPADGLADALVWQVAPAPDGTVWFSTHGGGVSRFDPSSGRWTTFTAPDSFPLANARKLVIGPDGLPWVHIGYDNVYRFDGRQWVLAYAAGGGQWVCDLAFDAGGAPWIATCDGWHVHGGGLVYQDGGEWRAITTADGLVADDLTALALRPDGVIAVGSRQGISVRQDGRWRTLRSGPTLAAVTGVAVAADGVAWFAFGDDHGQAAGGGLAAFDGRRWRYVTRANGLPVPDNVRVLTLAPDGSLWAGGACQLARLRGERWEIMAACDPLDGNIRQLAFAPDGAVWFASEWNLFRLSGGVLTRYEQQLPLALTVAADGAAWVSHNPALRGGWISRFDGQAWRPLTDTLGVGVVTSLAATPDGAVWAGSGAGVARLAGPGGPRLYTAADGLPAGGVAALAVAAEGALWAASPTAVARLTGDRWQTYDLGVGAAQVIALAPRAAAVWLATSRGAFFLSMP